MLNQQILYTCVLIPIELYVNQIWSFSGDFDNLLEDFTFLAPKNSRLIKHIVIFILFLTYLFQNKLVLFLNLCVTESFNFHLWLLLFLDLETIRPKIQLLNLWYNNSLKENDLCFKLTLSFFFLVFLLYIYIYTCHTLCLMRKKSIGIKR